MAKRTFTEAQVQKMIADAIAQALAAKPSTAGKGKAKTATFTKHDGTKVACTPAQAEAWTKYRDGYADRQANKEANLQAWATKRQAYKPTEAFKKAIKADRASITLAVAKEKFGFVGTKNDLKALKDSICK